MNNRNLDEQEDAIEEVAFKDTVHEEPQERRPSMGDPAEKLNETLWGVDLETGEMFDPTVKALTKDLPKAAGILFGVQREQDRLRAYRKVATEEIQADLDRVAERVQQEIDRLERKKGFIVDKAEDLMKLTGDQRLLYPGYGTFKFGSTRESVNDDDYADFSDEGKATTHAEFPLMFRVKTVVSPDKALIKASIAKGMPIPGFSIKEKHPTFGFKAEVDNGPDMD